MNEKPTCLQVAERAIATAEASTRLACVLTDATQRKAAIEVAQQMIELAQLSLEEAWSYASES